MAAISRQSIFGSFLLLYRLTLPCHGRADGRAFAAVRRGGGRTAWVGRGGLRGRGRRRRRGGGEGRGRARGESRARSHYRFVLPLILFLPDSLIY